MKVPVIAALAMCFTIPCPAQEEKPATPPPATAPAPVKAVTADEASKMLDKAAGEKGGKITVIDIRTSVEFEMGHIPGSVNIDFLSRDFREKIGALDKKGNYLVLCQSGVRSNRSLETFRKQGFPSVLHLEKGFAEWQKAGLPVEKAK